MQSYIISGGDQDERLLKAKAIASEGNIDPFDISTLSTDPEDEKSNSIGIKEVKIMQQKIFLKPSRGTAKACIITEADKLTLPAQNALLKLLEEPPTDTLIFLLIQNARQLLPTIRSRCSEIDISPKEAPAAYENEEELLAQWQTYKKGSINLQLKAAQDFAKDKDKGIENLKKFLFVFSRQLQLSIKNGGTDIKSLSQDIKAVQEAHTLLTTTNTNPRLVFEHLFLSLT